MTDNLSSSAFVIPGFDDYFEYNMWNPVLELLFPWAGNGIFASYLVEIDLAKIALSCHFALDLRCYKEEVLAFARWYIEHHGPCNSLSSVAPLPPAGNQFPEFADFKMLVLSSLKLFAVIEVAGLVEATLDGLIKVTFDALPLLNFLCPVFVYRPWHAVTNSNTGHICFVTLSNVFACCSQDTVVQASIVADVEVTTSYIWLP